MTVLTATPTRGPAETPPTRRVGPEELRGRSIGVFVCAGFGLLWAGPALSRFTPNASTPLVAASIAIVGALIVGGLAVRHAAMQLPRSQPSTAVPSRRIGRRFALVVSAEGAAGAAAVGIITATGHPHLLPAVICAAVGLHFVPLAAMFKIRFYYATAAALCLVAAATLILVPTTADAPSLWQILPGLGAAVSLWATGAILIAQSLALTRPAPVSAR